MDGPMWPGFVKIMGCAFRGRVVQLPLVGQITMIGMISSIVMVASGVVALIVKWTTRVTVGIATVSAWNRKTTTLMRLSSGVPTIIATLTRWAIAVHSRRCMCMGDKK